MLSEEDGGGRVLAPRLGTGGPFSGIFLWDTAFTVLWAKYYVHDLPVENSLDNLYRLQDEDGFIHREYTADGLPVWPQKHPISFAPPVLSWAELDLFEVTRDKERLERIYPHLVSHHRFCVEQFRRDDGLFIGDPWGTGMDNLPRWPQDYKGEDDCQTVKPDEVHPTVRDWFMGTVYGSIRGGWNEQGRYIDMSAQMALDALCLSAIAQLLDRQDDAAYYLLERSAISDVINERCWSDSLKFYCDLGYGTPIPRRHIGAYWTLIAGIVPPERLDPFLAHLENPNRFDRPVPVPCLSADDRNYEGDGGYWLGASWPPTTYMVLRGLQEVGARDLARRLAKKYVDAIGLALVATGTLWENMSAEAPVAGRPAFRDYCGWAGLGPVAIQREFLGGKKE